MKTLICCMALALACIGCARPKPVHVPLVHYHATIQDKHCKRLPDGVRFQCDQVILDPEELDATGSK